MPEERIRPSATVILWRRAPLLEVYLVERNKETRFFPGYHAFPGGVLDAEDGEGEASWRKAGVREVAEEVGITLAPDALLPAGRLITPPFGPVRYDTAFFMAELAMDAEPKVDGKELVAGEWVRPEEALARWEREAWPLPPPTLAYLRLLRDHQDARKAADAARATDGKPHHERFRIEIHPGVYVLPMRTHTLPPATTTNCYLFDSDPILVVDPGSDSSEEQVALFHTLDQMIEERQREILVLLTHHHTDHIGAVEAVQRRYGVRTLGSHETKAALPDHFVDGVISEGHMFDVGSWAGKPWRVDVLHTPGHTDGHLAFRDGRFNAIVAGDLVSGVSTILIPPGEGDMEAYLHSLERCSACEPRLVLPAHGPAMARDAFAEMLAHRRMRADRVAAALTAEPQDADAIVAVAYADTPREAWPLAKLNLSTILSYLETKGLARRDGTGWRR